MIPEAAVEAALVAIFPKGAVSEFGRTTWTRTIVEILEAAAPHMLAPVRDEIGYLCSRGHFVFHGDPDGDACGSKRTAGVYVERDPGVEFYGPYERADDDGFVYASGCGYSEEDYAEELTHARQSLTEQIETWRKS